MRYQENNIHRRKIRTIARVPGRPLSPGWPPDVAQAALMASPAVAEDLGNGKGAACMLHVEDAERIMGKFILMYIILAIRLTLCFVYRAVSCPAAWRLC